MSSLPAQRQPHPHPHHPVGRYPFALSSRPLRLRGECVPRLRRVACSLSTSQPPSGSADPTLGESLSEPTADATGTGAHLHRCPGSAHPLDSSPSVPEPEPHSRPDRGAAHSAGRRHLAYPIASHREDAARCQGTATGRQGPLQTPPLHCLGPLAGNGTVRDLGLAVGRRRDGRSLDHLSQPIGSTRPPR